MSRRVHAFQGSCHGPDVEWTCIACSRVVCGECEVSPREPEWCDQCLGPGDAA